MSKQQSTRRCWRCGPVPLSHKCESEQRPQAKMRGPTPGLTTGPAWDSARWAAYLRGKVETGAKAVTVIAPVFTPELSAIPFAEWRAGDVFGNRQVLHRFTVVGNVDGCIHFVRDDGIKSYFGYATLRGQGCALISRAQKAERALKVGDRVRVTESCSISRWAGREGVVVDLFPSGNVETDIADDSVSGRGLRLRPDVLELVRAVEG